MSVAVFFKTVFFLTIVGLAFCQENPKNPDLLRTCQIIAYLQNMEELETKLTPIIERVLNQQEASKFTSAVFSAFKDNVNGFSNWFGGVITYNTIVIGEDLLEKDTGIFTCKTGGTYSFVVSGWTQKNSEIQVFLNDGHKLQLQNGGSGNYDTFSYTWTLALNVGNRIQIKIEGGKFYVNPSDTHSNRVYFTGFLLA